MKFYILLIMAVIFIMAITFLIALVLIRNHFVKEFKYHRFRLMQQSLKEGDAVYLIEASPAYRGRKGIIVKTNKEGRVRVRFDDISSALWCDKKQFNESKKI